MVQLERAASSPHVSADGRVVVFDSRSPDLVPNDWNQDSDVFVARLEMRDSDEDGLEDGWEIQRFGDLSANPAGDTDNDGFSAREEFLAGTNPRDASSQLPKMNVVQDAGGDRFAFETVAWRTYQLQYRDSLSHGTWLPVGAPIMAMGDVLEIPVERAQSKKFYRVQIGTR